MDKAVIIGAGTYGAVYAAYLKNSYDIIGFLDDKEKLHGKTVEGLKVLGGTASLPSLKAKGLTKVFVPIGNNKVRVKILSNAIDLGFDIPSFIHPSCMIHETVKIGKGVYALPGAQIMPYTIVEDFCMLSMGVNVAHHVTLSKGVFLSQGVNVGASIFLGARVFCGIGSTIMTGVKTVGEDALIGGGAMVIRDVASSAKVVGNPARELKS